jgi:hypothetical protein
MVIFRLGERAKKGFPKEPNRSADTLRAALGGAWSGWPWILTATWVVHF